jgi:hypothetical protein
MVPPSAFHEISYRIVQAIFIEPPLTFHQKLPMVYQRISKKYLPAPPSLPPQTFLEISRENSHRNFQALP